MKRLAWFLAFMMIAAVGCGDDDPAGPGGDGPVYGDLTRRIDVLNNVELAWTQRNYTQYDKLVDDGFTFFFAPSDVGGGLPASWGRADELFAVSRMFDPNYAGSNRCTAIAMDIVFEDGVTWTPFNPASAPAETWYRTTVFYQFKINTAPDNIWLAVPGAKLQFTVRNAGTEDAPVWKLVELHDLGESNFVDAARTATASTTLGKVKYLFR